MKTSFDPAVCSRNRPHFSHHPVSTNVSLPNDFDPHTPSGNPKDPSPVRQLPNPRKSILTDDLPGWHKRRRATYKDTPKTGPTLVSVNRTYTFNISLRLILKVFSIHLRRVVPPTITSQPVVWLSDLLAGIDQRRQTGYNDADVSQYDLPVTIGHNS